ncbi:MAG: hypothetical protein ABIQ07_05735 [Ginsengibacter sp.]
MKKLTTITVALLLLFSASAFSMDSGVSAKIQTVFEKDFASASDVTWTQREDVYVASFTINNNQLAAAYNADGELLVMSRYINTAQLPLKVTSALREKYAGYTIGESVIELAKEQTSYLINLENAKYKINAEVDASGNWYAINRTKKR